MESADMESRKQFKSFSIESLISKNTSPNKTPQLEIVNVTEEDDSNRGMERVANLGGTPSFLTSTPQLSSRSLGLQDRLSPEIRSTSPIGSDDGDKENKMTLLTVTTQKAQYSSPNTSNGSENSECDTSGSRKKKSRTAFSAEQLAELEKRFRLHKYLGTDERSKLAEELGLSDQQVKTWFQNRRMKEKRQIREMEQLQTIPMSSSLVANESIRYPFGYSSMPPVSTVSASPLPGIALLPPSFLPKTATPSFTSLTPGLLTSFAPMGLYPYSVPKGNSFHMAPQHSVPPHFPVRPILQ